MSGGTQEDSAAGSRSPGQDFKRKIIFNLSILSVPPVMFIIVYLVALVRLMLLRRDQATVELRRKMRKEKQRKEAEEMEQKLRDQQAA